MKKLFLVPISLFSLIVSAQTTIQLKNLGTGQVLAANEIIPVTTSASSNVKVTLDIKNTTNSVKTYNVKRYDAILNTVGVDDQASAYFCFGGSCYGAPTITSPNALVLQANKSASDTTAAYYMLIADLDEATKIGYSLVKYTFFNVNNVNDSIQISIKYNYATVGINKVNKDLSAIDIFPNPATESAFLKVNAINAFDSKVTIYNALGAVVSEKQTYINEGKTKIDLGVENLSPGLYFVNLKTNDSSVTKRLVVK